MKCGEVGFLPAARETEQSTVIIANGFSCKTQLEESDVGRAALHTAEVMRIARKLGAPRMHGALPEQLREERPAAPRPVQFARMASTVAILGAVALAGFGAFSIFRRE